MKRILITTISVLFIFYLLINCTSNNFNSPLPCANNSTPLNLLNYSQDTLKIIVEKSDCGEWGGHREYILLQKNKENRFIANFIVDSVSCDNIISIYENGYNYGSGIDENSRVIVIDTFKTLTKSDEKIINKFIVRIMDLYLRQEMYSNAGTTYHIQHTDSTLDIKYWNNGDCKNTNYGKVRKKLFGEFLK